MTQRFSGRKGGDITLKVTHEANNELRRFSLAAEDQNLTALRAKLEALWPQQSGLTLKYKDDEGDMITIGTDEELLEGLTMARKLTPNVVRLSITSTPKGLEPKPAIPVVQPEAPGQAIAVQAVPVQAAPVTAVPVQPTPVQAVPVQATGAVPTGGCGLPGGTTAPETPNTRGGAPPNPFADLFADLDGAFKAMAEQLPAGMQQLEKDLPVALDDLAKQLQRDLPAAMDDLAEQLPKDSCSAKDSMDDLAQQLQNELGMVNRAVQLQRVSKDTSSRIEEL